MSCTDPEAPPQPIKVPRGANWTLTFYARDASGALVDLTGGKAWFTVKNRIEDANAIIAKRNVAAGGVDGQALITLPQTGVALGQFKAFLTQPDTLLLDPSESYWCDAWAQTAGGVFIQAQPVTAFQLLPTVTTIFF